MGLECGSIKGLEGIGGMIEGGYREDIGEVYIPPKKYRRCGEGRVAADF